MLMLASAWQTSACARCAECLPLASHRTGSPQHRCPPASPQLHDHHHQGMCTVIKQATQQFCSSFTEQSASSKAGHGACFALQSREIRSLLSTGRYLQMLALRDLRAAVRLGRSITAGAQGMLNEHNRHRIGPLKPGPRAHLRPQYWLFLGNSANKVITNVLIILRYGPGPDLTMLLLNCQSSSTDS